MAGQKEAVFKPSQVSKIDPVILHQQIRKMQNASNYEINFGSRPKAAQDYEVLKVMSFRDLNMISVL